MGFDNANRERYFKYMNLAVFVCVNLLYLLLSFSEVFSYDEAYTIGMINRSFRDIINITSSDVHSPFYYFVLKIFFDGLGMQELFSTRVFSWIFMCLQLIVGGKICRKMYGRSVEFYWLLLSGFMPAMIIQSTNARMYTMGLFFVTVAAYLAYKLYKCADRCNWVLFTLVAVIAVYIHTFCMIEMVIVYGIFIIAVLRKKDYKTLGKIFISGLVVSISFSPWLSVLYHQFRRWAGKEAGWGNTIEKIGLHSFVDYICEWFSSLERPNPYVIVFSIILVFIAGVYTIKYVMKSKDLFPCLGVMAAGITFVIAMLVSVFIVPCFLGRYLFFLFGGLWLFVAVGMSRMKHIWIKMILIVGVLVCGFVTFHEEMQLRDDEGLKDYLTCMEAEWKEDDVIMADTYFTLMMSIYYPHEDYMIYGGMANCIPFDNVSVFTEWEQLDGVDRVWYLSFSNLRTGNLDEYYTVVNRKNIPYSYYDIVLEEYVRK